MSGSQPRSPRETLLLRLQERRARAAWCERRDARVAGARLVVFTAGAALAGSWAWTRALSAWWILLPAAGFVALVVLHDRVLRDLGRARRAAAFHEEAVARLEGKPPAGGQSGARFGRGDHPYAQDLDLFGDGSLFHLLCTARTRPGEERLAAWLLAPASPAEVRARQRAVAELAPRLDLREALAVLGEDVRAAVDPGALAAWGRAPPALGTLARAAALTSAVASVAGAALWAAGAGPLPLVTAGLAAALLRRALRAPLARVLGSLDRPSAELAVLSLLLSRLEREPFEDAHLAGQQARLGTGSAARLAPHRPPHAHRGTD